jgi:hypothetical protein
MVNNVLERVAVLEWQAWKGFLLLHVLGENAIRIETDPFAEFPTEQFDFICETCTVVCFQINLSVRSQLPINISNLTDRFTERGLYVVNGIIQDIRKSTLQAHLEMVGLPSLRARPDGPGEEMLFVKTNLNYGGELERWLPAGSVAAGKLEHLVSNEFGAYRYKTIQRRFIKEELWHDPSLVIERYVTNTENSFYRVYFSGDQVVIVKAFAPGMIKKLSGDDRDTNFVTDLDHLKASTDELPLSESLKQDVAIFIDTAPVEFGSLDIVHDGHDNHFIIDLNLTPFAGTRPHDPFLISFLKLGIIDPLYRKELLSNNSPLAGELKSTTAAF